MGGAEVGLRCLDIGLELAGIFSHTFNENSKFHANANRSEIHTISIYPALEGLGFRGLGFIGFGL